MQQVQFETLEWLRQFLSEHRQAAVFLSASAAERWKLSEQLKQNSSLLWFDRIVPNPTEQTVAEALQQVRAAAPDCLIAIGGGSAIDLAKAVSALYPGTAHDAAAIKQAIQSKQYLETRGAGCLPLIGTGSEVTQWATVWDSAAPKKFSVDAAWLLPQQVAMIPELTLSMPPKLMLSTGLDAVAHACEAFWSRHTDPLAQSLAVRALEIMTRNLRTGMEHPDDLQVRTALSTGALVAGLAFSRTRTTACHSISYPMTSLFGVPHGFAVALTLAEIGEINRAVLKNQELYEVFAPYQGIEGWLKMVCAGTATLRLSAFEITEAELPLLVEHAFTSGRMDNNPLELTPERVEQILRSVL